MTEAQGRQLRLIVVIVNWRTSDLTIACLHSMVAEVAQMGECMVCVVDNDSQDGSAAQIAKAIDENGWNSWARVIQADVNGGFASGNNFAVRYLWKLQYRSDYILFLNPDTRIRGGAFRIIAEFLDAHPDAGVAGGRSEDPDATPQECCFRFPTIVSETCSYLGIGLVDRMCARWITRLGILSAPAEVGWVSGAYMMVRAEVFDDIGLLDEGYFLYFEETDFVYRARRAGWRCWHVPEGRIVHLVGQSSGLRSDDNQPPRRPQYWFESRRRYFVLNHGVAYAALTDILAMLAMCLRSVKSWLRRDRVKIPYFFRDFVRNSVLVNGRRKLELRRTHVSD